MATHKREVVVEFDGLWFRLKALRGRRGFRGKLALQMCFGAEGYKMLSTPTFWVADEQTQLEALIVCEIRTKPKYDEVDAAMMELLAYTSGVGGQGVEFRPGPPDPERPDAGWTPIRSMEALDPYDAADHCTWEALRWEMVKLTYRPTLAATGIFAGTPSAATTSTQVSRPAGAPKPQPTGDPKAEILASGISSG